MELTLPERIQILRKRTGLNQGQLGSRAFNTSIDSGRTKIKNIELGKQKPTADDIKGIARCLGIPPAQLEDTKTSATTEIPSSKGIFVSHRVLDLFPELGEYLEMLDKAAELKDGELVAYLAGRIGEIMHHSAPDPREQTRDATSSVA